MSSVRDFIKKNGYYCATVHGTSMLPLLKNHRDSVYVVTPDKLKKYDVVLFERANDQLVLHRIMKVQEDVFYISGDNDITLEKVSREQIIGKMTEFSVKDKEYTTQALWYRLYSRLWGFSNKTKRPLLFLYKLPRKIKARLKHN